MGTTRKIAGSILDTQKENNYFSDPYFQLAEGFTGKYNVLYVEELTKRGEDTPYAHRVIVKSPKGTMGLHAGLLSRAIIVNDAELDGIDSVKDGVKDVFYAEDTQHLGESFSNVYERAGDGMSDFEYPEHLEILGAYVYKDRDEERPQVGLRHYPLYSIIKRHHNALTKDYITRDEIDNYINASGNDRPAGLPAGYKFELLEADKWNMRNWNFRLIIKDWR